MTLPSILRTIRLRWITAVVTIGVFLLLSLAYTLLRGSTYTANLTMYVSAQIDNNATAAYQGGLLSQQRVASYVELVKSPRVLAAVAAQPGVALDEDELESRITATTQVDSVLIDVSASDRSGDRSALIVNTVGEVFPELIAELERPAREGVPPPVSVKVVQPAEIPTDPDDTSLLENLGVGLLVGVVASVLAALVKEALDTRVRTPAQLEAQTGLPLLGAIPYVADSTDLAKVLSGRNSNAGESVREIRTNLQYVGVDDPPRIVTITSSAAGEGKSTTSCSLAIAMADAGQRVLLVEADLRKPRIGDYLGLPSAVGVSSVLSRRTTIEHASQRYGSDRLQVLCAGPKPPNPNELLASENMAALLRRARELFDLVVVDTPPLLAVPDAAAVSVHTDGVLLVCGAGMSTREQLTLSVKKLENVKARLIGTVLTKARIRDLGSLGHYGQYYSDVSSERDERQEGDDLTYPLGAHSMSAQARPSPSPRR